MTGFEPGSSDIGSDRSANCATTTALEFYFSVVNYDRKWFLRLATKLYDKIPFL